MKEHTRRSKTQTQGVVCPSNVICVQQFIHVCSFHVGDGVVTDTCRRYRNYIAMSKEAKDGACKVSCKAKDSVFDD